jgi:hypothetical protein
MVVLLKKHVSAYHQNWWFEKENKESPKKMRRE